MNDAKRGLPAMVSVAMALSVVIGLGAGTADPGPSIETGYSEALASATRAPDPSSPTPISGSEAYWLGQPYQGREAAARVEPARWQSPGETIIVGEGSHQRKLEIVAVRPIEETATRIDTAAGIKGLDLTVRDPADPEGKLEHLVVSVPAPTAPARAL